MTIKINNILDAIPGRLAQELVQVLAKNNGVRIERIISRGHGSPPGFWYDQEQNGVGDRGAGQRSACCGGKNKAHFLNHR